MRAFRYSMHIEKTPGAVFDFMMDFTNASRWRNLVRRIDVVTAGPLRVGSELRITIDVLGAVKEVSSELWAYEPPRRYGLCNTTNHVTGAFEYTLEPQNGGTLVQFTCDVGPHGWMWLALPLLIMDSRVRYRDQLRNLKTAIEEDPSPVRGVPQPRRT